jgi:hypothetical protein
MKNLIFLLTILVIVSSCSTSKKGTTVSTPAPVPPEGVTFTKVENFKAFKTIHMPFEGNGFGKDINAVAKNDAGENIPQIRHYGQHIYLISDLSELSDVGKTGTDIELALEKVKKTMYLKFQLRKENIQQEYTDVKIAGKTVKKFILKKPWTSGDKFSLTIGYIVPHNNTTAMIILDSEPTDSSASELLTKQIEEVFEYMIATTEFREFQNK